MLRPLLALALAASGTLAAAAGRPAVRTVEFTTDPGWESYRSHLVPDPPRFTRQEFGYSATRHCGQAAAGEVGGWVQRSITPAAYAREIPRATLNDRLTAAGSFAVIRAEGGSGLLFGWFNSHSRGWRTPSSLVFRIDGNGGKYWVFYEYATQKWRSGGGGCLEGQQYQTTRSQPFLPDGTVHRWVMTYHPQENGAGGQLAFELDGRRYLLPLGPGHRGDGAEFDRFGILNQMTTGGAVEAYFSDLTLNGRALDLSRDPHWKGTGNRTRYEERALRPYQNFGYAPSHAAGGKAGEVGGMIWRDERPAYYADRVARLTLDDELEASGRLGFTGAGSDSGVYLGWFDSASKQGKVIPEAQEPPRNVLALLIEGPSRVGHYFRPACYSGTGSGAAKADGPVIRPDGKPHRWLLRYTPGGAGGRGEITFRLDDQEQTFELPAGIRQAGARFDRFGIFNPQTGGQYVCLFLDDLRYTAGAP